LARALASRVSGAGAAFRAAPDTRVSTVPGRAA